MWSQERYELSLCAVCCLIPRLSNILEMGLGMRLIVSNNDDAILLSVTLYVAQKWNRSCQVSTLDFS